MTLLETWSFLVFRVFFVVFLNDSLMIKSISDERLFRGTHRTKAYFAEHIGVDVSEEIKSQKCKIIL